MNLDEELRDIIYKHKIRIDHCALPDAPLHSSLIEGVDYVFFFLQKGVHTEELACAMENMVTDDRFYEIRDGKRVSNAAGDAVKLYASRRYSEESSKLPGRKYRKDLTLFSSAHSAERTEDGVEETKGDDMDARSERRVTP